MWWKLKKETGQKVAKHVYPKSSLHLQYFWGGGMAILTKEPFFHMPGLSLGFFAQKSSSNRNWGKKIQNRRTKL